MFSVELPRPITQLAGQPAQMWLNLVVVKEGPGTRFSWLSRGLASQGHRLLTAAGLEGDQRGGCKVGEGSAWECMTANSAVSLGCLVFVLEGTFLMGVDRGISLKG